MKDALMQALKAYGGPAGLIADLHLYAQGEKEEAEQALEDMELTLNTPSSPRETVLEALAQYWASVEDALEDVENNIDKAGFQFGQNAKKHTKREAWRLNPERLILKKRRAK